MKTEFKYDLSNVIMLMELWRDNLINQKDKKATFADFCLEVKELFKSGKIKNDDIMELQNHGMRLPEMMELSGHLTENSTTKMSYHDAVEMGHKIQFIYLSYHQKQGRTDGTTLFANSMKPHEDGIDAIYNGTYDPEKLKVLEDLPTIEKWDHDLAVEAYPKIF